MQMNRLSYFGLNVRQQRMELGLTQLELAERCDVNIRTIWCLENGSRFPSLQLLIRLAESLETSIDSLLLLPDEKETESAAGRIAARVRPYKNGAEMIAFLYELSELLIKYFSKRKEDRT